MVTLAFIAALLAIPPTTARAEDSRWSWIAISSTGGEWRRQDGPAEVAISAGRFEAKLYASDGYDFAIYRVFGSVREIGAQRTRPRGVEALALGKVEATFEAAAVDLASFSCGGEYRKTEITEGYEPESSEALLLYCNGVFYGLTHKLNKIAPKP